MQESLSPVKQPSAPDPKTVYTEGAQLELYNPKNILVLPGKPGRFAFKRVSNGRVWLQHVSPKGKRYGSLSVPAAKFERQYIVALTDHQRALIRTKVLIAIHTSDTLPPGTPDRVLRSAFKWLKSEGLIQSVKDEDGDDSWETTKKGAEAAERMLGLTTKPEPEPEAPDADAD